MLQALKNLNYAVSASEMEVACLAVLEAQSSWKSSLPIPSKIISQFESASLSKSWEKWRPPLKTGCLKVAKEWKATSYPDNSSSMGEEKDDSKAGAAPNKNSRVRGRRK